MIVTTLRGGLGNQMFIYAMARAMALRNDVPMAFDLETGFKRDIEYHRHLELCDHTGVIIDPRVKHFKIMLQKNLFTYSYCEDCQLSIINYSSCKIPTVALDINYKTSHYDEFMSIRDNKPKNQNPYMNVEYPKRKNEYQKRNVMGTYAYFFKKGYIPFFKRKNGI